MNRDPVRVRLEDRMGLEDIRSSELLAVEFRLRFRATFGQVTVLAYLIIAVLRYAIS
jgi:hypothetical protein